MALNHRHMEHSIWHFSDAIYSALQLALNEHYVASFSDHFTEPLFSGNQFFNQTFFYLTKMKMWVG